MLPSFLGDVYQTYHVILLRGHVARGHFACGSCCMWSCCTWSCCNTRTKAVVLNVAQLRLAREQSEAEMSAKLAAMQLQLSAAQGECDLLKRALSQLKARSKKMEQLQVMTDKLVVHEDLEASN